MPTIVVQGLYTLVSWLLGVPLLFSLLSSDNHIQLPSLPFSVSKGSLFQLVKLLQQPPFPAKNLKEYCPFLLCYSCLWCSEHPAILLRLLQRPFLSTVSRSSLTLSLLLLCCSACNAQGPQQSYQTQLRTAELICETRLPFVSSLPYKVLC